MQGIDREADILILSDTNISPIKTYISRYDPSIRTAIGAFDQVIPELMGKNLRRYTLIVITTQLTKISSQFNRLCCYNSFDKTHLLEEVRKFAEFIAGRAEEANAIAVLSWILPPWIHTNRSTNWKGQFCISRIIAEANILLSERLESVGNTFIIDQAELLIDTNETIFDPKMWVMGKIAYSAASLQSLAGQIVGLYWALTGKDKKLIILDLDNTLWGGIVGEDGWQNLRLGGTDPIGESYSIFQRELKSLSERGILLAIVSKNTEETALEAIEKHPEMILRKEDFVSWRINWKDKATNIKEIAEEINIGLQSIVFIDDSPHERDWVRKSLPEVFVPDWPADPVLYPYALKRLVVFEKLKITEEDKRRKQMLQDERKRKEIQYCFQSKEEWISSLQLKIKIEPISEENIARVIQLFNRTNQFNLTTRRLTEETLKHKIDKEDLTPFVISAEDKFGSYGIIGAISFRVNSEEKTCYIEDLLISCRALGREIEECILTFAQKYAYKSNSKKLCARYIPTRKNRPILEFLRKTASKELPKDKDVIFEYVPEDKPYPNYIEVEDIWKTNPMI